MWLPRGWRGWWYFLFNSFTFYFILPQTWLCQSLLAGTTVSILLISVGGSQSNYLDLIKLLLNERIILHSSFTRWKKLEQRDYMFWMRSNPWHLIQTVSIINSDFWSLKFYFMYLKQILSRPIFLEFIYLFIKVSQVRTRRPSLLWVGCRHSSTAATLLHHIWLHQSQRWLSLLAMTWQVVISVQVQALAQVPHNPGTDWGGPGPLSFGGRRPGSVLFITRNIRERPLSHRC